MPGPIGRVMLDTLAGKFAPEILSTSGCPIITDPAPALRSPSISAPAAGRLAKPSVICCHGLVLCLRLNDKVVEVIDVFLAKQEHRVFGEIASTSSRTIRLSTGTRRGSERNPRMKISDDP